MAPPEILGKLENLHQSCHLRSLLQSGTAFNHARPGALLNGAWLRLGRFPPIGRQTLPIRDKIARVLLTPFRRTCKSAASLPLREFRFPSTEVGTTAQHSNASSSPVTHSYDVAGVLLRVLLSSPRTAQHNPPRGSTLPVAYPSRGPALLLVVLHRSACTPIPPQASPRLTAAPELGLTGKSSGHNVNVLQLPSPSQPPSAASLRPSLSFTRSWNPRESLSLTTTEPGVGLSPASTLPGKKGQNKPAAQASVRPR